MKNAPLRLVLTALFCLLLANCSKEVNDDGNGGGGGGTQSCTIPSAQKSELAYCPSIPLNTPSPAVTITGTARYEFRATSSSGLGGGTLSTRPIRFAEIRVSNSNGNLIQCAETDNSGNFSMLLPADSQSYTIAVSSRGQNSSANVSVLNSPDQNDFYTLSTSVTTDGSKSVGTFTASGRGDVLGGAFNIFDQIVKSQEFIKTSTAGCTGLNGPNVNCSPYNPLTTPSGGTAKVSAFWKKGFNPNSYFCNDSSGLSFYLPSADQLYILGGIGGDVDSSDTDHYDNSVIIHELAHFLEDQYAKSDSPGGSHDGNSVLDPRLMWSEGWANFFQGAVSDTPLYQDTFGNADGSTGNFFFQSLEFRCQSGTSNDGAGCFDLPTTTGEGNFREFATARALWDLLDDGTNATNGDDQFNSGTFTDDFSIPFQEIWTGFLNLASSSLSFRNVGLFHELTTQLTGATTTNFTDYKTLVTTGERQQPNRIDYANPISASSTCTTTIPSSGSNQFKAHDYYDYTHSTAGTLALDLTHNDSSGARDVDLYLYREDYTLFSSSKIIAASNEQNDGGTESISVTNLPAGRYLINVHYFQGPVNQTYSLTLTNNANPGGKKVCPETSF